MSPADTPRRGTWFGKRFFREIGDTSRFNVDNYFVCPSGCYLWCGALNDKGYAIVGTNRDGTFRATRIVWERAHGPLEPGLQPDHKCRNRACIRLEHLEPITNAENTRRGDRAKLNREQVAEIRRLRSEEGLSYRAIAKRFNIHNTTAHDAVNGRRWGDV